MGVRNEELQQDISIHALREEGDQSEVDAAVERINFYPRPPRGGRQPTLSRSEPKEEISIHALREEGDWSACQSVPHSIISIHALREEGDGQVYQICMMVEIFLSTPSARRATLSLTSKESTDTHFYPRPPRGGRPMMSSFHAIHQTISIHALREEGDLTEIETGVQQSVISIHALREEGDTTRHLCSNSHKNFYPRPPRGGRPPLAHRTQADAAISIHALREEGDLCVCR